MGSEKKLTKTVLITGASTGIGRALALCFAKENYNLVIIGRNKEKLGSLKTECVKNYPIDVLEIVVDLSSITAVYEIIDQLKQAKITIQILVNNAGFGIFGNFAETNLQEEEQLLTVHINSMLFLVKALLPDLKQTRGKILNVGSVYSFCPILAQSIYAASKAFILSFSLALRGELQPQGISVSVLCPGMTYTEFRTRAGFVVKPTWFGMHAEKVAELGYQGLIRNKAIIIPGVINKTFVFICRHTPLTFILAIVKWASCIRDFKILPSSTSA
jgi:short-subunit dehydrogenase